MASFLNKDQILKRIRRDPHQLMRFSEQQIDKEIALEAISRDGRTYCYLSAHLRGDKDIILKTLNNTSYEHIWNFIPDYMLQDPDIMQLILAQEPSRLERASPWVKDNRDLVLGVIRRNGFLLEFASERLQNDPELRLIATLTSPLYLNNTPEFKDDRDMVLTLVHKNGMALEYVSERLKNDMEVVVTALKSNGLSIFYAPPWVMKDFGMVMTAIYSNGYTILALPLEMVNTITLKAAINISPYIIGDLPSIQDDVRFISAGEVLYFRFRSQRMRDQWSNL